ncbi:MAG TPA: serine/threonine-protein kinase [Anaeromyxobacter sp.]
MPSSPAPRRPALDRTVGRVLGDRYRVLSRLGEGGMGTVYLCEHAVLGRRYAVKVLRPELGGDPELAERFRNEAIAASRIGGENVVDVVDFGAERDGALYYVMEALDGRSLGAIVAEEGPLDVARALGLLEQVCRALGAAHARGVVHRDVKPDNVFVVRRPDGTELVKVIDFGVSQVSLDDGRERLTRAGAIIGTPEYMAPEQAAGEPVDQRADVYALGVLAYELLTATLPIVAHTPVATLVAHQTRTPEAPSRRRASVPLDVDALVLCALAKRPEDRPQTMGAFADAIARIRRPGAAPKPPAASVRTLVRPRDTVALPESSRPFRRRMAAWRRRALVAVAVAIALGAGVLLWGWTARRSALAPALATTPPAASAAPAPTAASPAPPPSAAGPAAPGPASNAPAAPGAAPARKPPARTSRSPRQADSHLEDPYAPGALKSDPFQ